MKLFRHIHTANKIITINSLRERGGRKVFLLVHQILIDNTLIVALMGGYKRLFVKHQIFIF